MLKSFLSGGFGGMCLVFAGHPLDLIKVRMQTMPIIEGQAPLYTSALDCARKTVAKDGVRGLYKVPTYLLLPVCLLVSGVSLLFFDPFTHPTHSFPPFPTSLCCVLCRAWRLR